MEQNFNVTEKADENNGKLTIICIDPNNEIEDFNQQLNAIHNRVIFHTKIDSCLIFIQSIENEKIFFVTSDINVAQILSQIDIFRHVDCIFIFYLKKNECKSFFHEHLNIIGIYYIHQLKNKLINNFINGLSLIPTTS